MQNNRNSESIGGKAAQLMRCGRSQRRRRDNEWSESPVAAARLAVEAFGGSAMGLPTEILVGDHQRPDISFAITRRWFDEEGVDVAIDLANCAAALALQDVARQRSKISLPVGAITSARNGWSCGTSASGLK